MAMESQDKEKAVKQHWAKLILQNITEYRACIIIFGGNNSLLSSYFELHSFVFRKLFGLLLCRKQRILPLSNKIQFAKKEPITGV